jgi:hypothetical protein
MNLSDQAHHVSQSVSSVERAAQDAGEPRKPAAEDSLSVVGGIATRLLSIASLAATVAGIAYAGHGLYQATADSWIVPINLSPDNDMVMQVNIHLNEQLLERSKLRADAARIDTDVEGIDVAIARLDAVHASGRESLRWTARATEAEASSLHGKVKSLTSERALLEDMLRRESDLVGKAQKNVERGLTPQQDHDREEQTLAQLRVTIAEAEREASDATFQSDELRRASAALREGAPAVRMGGEMLPQLVDQEERDVRIELERIKLEAERRSLVSQKAVTAESLAKMDEMLTQVMRRPIYRAVQASTDVAFVPYTQLKGVEAGADLVQCRYLIFKCHTVGRIAEVLPGEVVAQDPWSDVARGQYAILDLSDHEASQEKVLRVAPHSHR